MPQSRELPHVPFTEDMKKDYTILVPNMLPVQFKLITSIMKNYGYTMEVLETEGPQIAECGLKNVHNDTCYPALFSPRRGTQSTPPAVWRPIPIPRWWRKAP